MTTHNGMKQNLRALNILSLNELLLNYSASQQNNSTRTKKVKISLRHSQNNLVRFQSHNFSINVCVCMLMYVDSFLQTLYVAKWQKSLVLLIKYQKTWSKIFFCNKKINVPTKISNANNNKKKTNNLFGTQKWKENF